MSRAVLRGLAIACALLAAAGCSTGGSRFNGPVLDIDGDLLGRYWIVRQSEYTFEAPPAERDDCVDGYVVLRYVIDSYGSIFEAEILESVPNGCFEDAAVMLLKSWTYLPSQFNTRRKPVRVTQRIPFTSE
ncbi:MAG: TonB family protein [Pseudomonadota bacterium]